MTTLPNHNIYIATNTPAFEDALLTQVRPRMEWKDGQRTDNLIGYIYTVALPNHGCELLDVKIDGEKRMDAIPGKSIAVKLNNLMVKAYVKHGTNQITFAAQADDIRAVEAHH